MVSAPASRRASHNTVMQNDPNPINGQFADVRPSAPIGRDAPNTYCTATVTPVCVLVVPTVITSGRLPVGAFAGIVTFTCITP